MPSHYLKQCWNIVNWTLGNKLHWNLNRNLNIVIQENAFENVVWKMATILSRPQSVKPSIKQTYGWWNEMPQRPRDATAMLHHTMRSMMTSSNGNVFRVTGPLCGEFTGPGEFPTQRPVTRSFDVFFDLRLNKRLSKQPWGWWFETPSWLLWRQCNALTFMWRHCNAVSYSIWDQTRERSADLSIWFGCNGYKNDCHNTYSIFHWLNWC